MSSSKTSVVLILGGAGAQNGAVTRVLSAAGTYSIHVLTRSSSSAHAAELGVLPNVKLVEGDCYDEDTLKSAFEGVDLCFVNTNGFAIGEKNEIFWGIRMYEIARWAGVKHFIYGGLPYVTKNGDFDPKRRVPFVDGKGKVTRLSTFFMIQANELTKPRVPCFNANKAYDMERSRNWSLR
jgi:nucleoside-diphosphate-sugar epimerase